ncbi:MAG TPA: Clp protease, partial [Treponema sp.]|nr:Clp protease [Treponema sp.]
LSPELLNRIDDVVVFHALDRNLISSIVDIQINELESRLLEQDLSVSLKPRAREYMVEHGYEPSMGARPMRRLIQHDVEDALANLLLSGKRGDSKEVVIDSDGESLKVSFKKTRKRIAEETGDESLVPGRLLIESEN